VKIDNVPTCQHAWKASVAVTQRIAQTRLDRLRVDVPAAVYEYAEVNRVSITYCCRRRAKHASMARFPHPNAVGGCPGWWLWVTRSATVLTVALIALIALAMVAVPTGSVGLTLIGAGSMSGYADPGSLVIGFRTIADDLTVGDVSQRRPRSRRVAGDPPNHGDHTPRRRLSLVADAG